MIAKGAPTRCPGRGTSQNPHGGRSGPTRRLANRNSKRPPESIPKIGELSYSPAGSETMRTVGTAMPKSTKKNSQLAKPLLRGQAEEDAELLAEAVAQINTLHSGKSLELYQALGQYLLDTFFDGKFENLGLEGKHASWRALARRDDLHVSYSQLRNAVHIHHQINLLGDKLAGKLSISHHRRLLAVHTPKEKQQLAKRAAEEGLTVKKFEVEVAKVRKREKTSKGGRPRLSDQLKSLSRLESLLAPLHEQEIGAEDVKIFGVEKVEEMLPRIDQQIETLQAAKKELQAALKGARE